MTVIRIISILTASFVLAASGRAAAAHAFCATTEEAPGPNFAASGILSDGTVAFPLLPAVFFERLPIVPDLFGLICFTVPGFSVGRPTSSYAYGFLFSGLSPP